jgi:4-methyl-5(b-hydroxyethyl)-thiazole monophosphate biosynthesis
MKNKVFLFLATGFEEIEAVATIDILRRAQIDTIVVSITGNQTVTGAHDITVEADSLFEQTDFSDGNMLILPGGMPGTKNLESFTPLTKLIGEYYKKGKFLAAICAAPSILGKMHLLRNEEVICYPGFEEFLSEAVISKQKVVRCNKLITAKGPGVAIEFGLKIVETLVSKELADELAAQVILT